MLAGCVIAGPEPGAVAERSREHASPLELAQLALDSYFDAADGASAGTDWKWAVYFLGLESVREATGRAEYADRILAWGKRNGWDPSVPDTPTSNPDNRAAIQVWLQADRAGLPVELEAAADLMAEDATAPASTYWWIDSLFMGLPLWPMWAERSGDSGAGRRSAEFYDFLKEDAVTKWRPECTPGGLFDETENLWWRDCRYVGERDELGNKVFWSRGNGWVLAAMARMVEELPAPGPERAEYAAMLQRMAARLVTLQGEDGLWRSSLLSPSLFPEPETSGTALMLYAIASGVRGGVLDEAVYRPALERGWEGLASAIDDSGFVSHCQAVGEAPGPSSTTESTPFCVGAVALAAAEYHALKARL